MPDNETEEFGDSIFTNEPEVIEGLRKSAEAVGVNPDLVAPEDANERVKHLARKSCKKCFGLGTITMVPSPQKQKVFWRTVGQPGKTSSRVKRRYPSGKKRRHSVVITRGPSVPKNRVMIGFSPANDELTTLWDDRDLSVARGRARQRRGENAEKFRGTSRPEPPNYKDEAIRSFLCGCVRTENVV